MSVVLKKVNPIVPFMDLRPFKSLIYKKNKSINYEILFCKKEGRFIVGGFSRYLFDDDGNCYDLLKGNYIRQKNQRERISLVNDEKIRSTLRLNGILSFILNK